jgi:hypothetical protein
MIKFDKNNDLYLFSLDEYEQLPAGIELESISGTKLIKGRDYIDLDTRFGHIAYGVRDIENHPNHNLLLKFLLKRAN